MLGYILKNSTKAEEEVITHVLTQVLGHTPNISDYQELSVIKKEGEFFKYTLCHKHIALGQIERRYQYLKDKELSDVLTVIFTPLPVLN